MTSGEALAATIWTVAILYTACAWWRDSGRG
jgi:hypothetical protein